MRILIAEDDGVPTIVRQSPLPARRLIGDLSQTERVVAALHLLPIPEYA
jgi:hypothetical protein